MHAAAQMDLVALRERFERAAAEVNGFGCRDWIASLPAPAGSRDVFWSMRGQRDLRREVFTPDRSEVISYTDWNQPIRLRRRDG